MLFDEIAEILWKHLITAAPVASQPCKHPPPPPPKEDNKSKRKSFIFLDKSQQIQLLHLRHIRDQVTVKKLHNEVYVRKLGNFRRNVSLSSIFLTSLETC